jgi:hypothetical protein
LSSISRKKPKAIERLKFRCVAAGHLNDAERNVVSSLVQQQQQKPPPVFFSTQHDREAAKN